MEQSKAVLTNSGGYTKFIFKGKTITFMHGKDLLKYLKVKEWEDGYIVVDCFGKVKGTYEDYIDMPYILEKVVYGSEGFFKRHAGGDDSISLRRWSGKSRTRRI